MYLKDKKKFCFIIKCAPIVGLLIFVACSWPFGIAWGTVASILLGLTTALFSLPPIQKKLVKGQLYQPDLSDEFVQQWLEKQRTNNFADPSHPAYLNWMRDQRPF